MIKATFELNGSKATIELMEGNIYINSKWIRTIGAEFAFAMFARGNSLLEATPQALSIIRKHNG